MEPTVTWGGGIVPAWYDWSLEIHAQLLTEVILTNVETV